MKINNTPERIYFGKKFDTVKVLEVTTQRVIGNDGLNGLKEMLSALYDNKGKPVGVGNRGYKYYAKLLGEQITKKYPDIKIATDEINNILEKEPYIKKENLQKKIQPILDKIGSTVDITI